MGSEQRNPRVRVLIVEDSRAIRDSLKSMLASEPAIAVVGECGDGEEAVRRARELRPDVILMDINLPGMDGLTAAAAIRRDVPARIVVVSVENNPECFRRAMQVGVSDYLIKPFSAADLLAAIRNAVGRDGAAASPAPAEAAPTRKGRVITVFSAKGGVGKTLLSVNLALLLSLRPRERTVLVDLDLENGTAATFLHLRPRASLADLARVQGQLDEGKVELALTRVPGHEFMVLAAPPWPHLAAEIEGQVPGEGAPPAEGGVRVQEVLAVLTRMFDWVVVDTAANFRDSNLVAFDHSDLLLLMTTPDIPAVANTGRCYELLVDRLGYPRERVRIVVNRRDPVAQVGVGEITEALGNPVVWELPHDAAAAVTSANTGQPLCGRRSRSPLAEAMGKLAEALVVQLGGEVAQPVVRAAAPAGRSVAVLPTLEDVRAVLEARKGVMP